MNTALRILIVMAILVPFWWSVAKEAQRISEVPDSRFHYHARRMGHRLSIAITATIVVAFGAALGAVSIERGGAEDMRDGQGIEYR